MRTETKTGPPKTKSSEVPLSFLCGKDRLYGILHQPAHFSSYGLLIVTGRPALRAGRHRLFVLLARAWAQAGIPVMRFDFRGTGDSEGDMGTLDDTSEDIVRAVDAFISNMPGLEKVVLWGLCGGAADSILYAPKDPRVIGIVVVNPWSYDARVRKLATLRRFAWSFFERPYRWARTGGLRKGLTAGLRRIANGGKAARTHHANELDALNDPDISVPHAKAAVDRAHASYRVPNLSKRLLDSLERFDGKVLLILGGQDTGSRVFKHTASISWRWRRWFSSPRLQSHELPEANHSLRRPEWRAQVAAWTVEWLRQLQPDADSHF